MAHSSLLGQALVAFVAVALLGQPALTVAAADASPPKLSAKKAADLVQAALDAELAGDAKGRRELLANATQLDPNYAPARWQSGQVYFDHQWRSVEQVQELVAQDGRWAEYRDLRASMTDSPADHLAMAQWCLRQGLDNEERFHWAKVLEADPNHVQARERLGLREYLGGLYTQQQIDAHQRQLKQAEQNLQRFKPRFVELCRQAASKVASEREAALQEIGAVKDIEAVEALDYAIARATNKGATKRGGRQLALELHLAMVSALSNMPEHAATVRLLDYAVFSSSDELRQRAAEALRPRPATDYVPLLMSALSAPMETEFDVLTDAEGSVAVHQKLVQNGPEATFAHSNLVVYERRLQPGPMRPVNPALFQRDLQRATTLVYQAQQEVKLANARAQERNSRIEALLRRNFGIQASGNPEVLWQAWREYNELYPTEDRPLIATQYYQSFVNYPSCFVAGTPVWTQAGPTPIERIVVGDLVLSQDPATGELGYRPVIDTTTRPPTGVVDVTLPEETITATLGHRFWVNGRGWEMAKFLKAKVPLHALDAPLEIAAVEESPPAEAFNLVVDDFHTYFVGQSRVLVHDNNCPRPTVASVPGGASRK